MIPPKTAPDPLLSEAGRRILDLLAHDLTLRQIARLCGCRHYQLQMLRDNPAATASRALVVQLETLHENVMTGKSKWGRMVEALVHHGWTYDQLAVRVGVSSKHLRTEFGNPLRVPGNDVAEVVEGLYRRHVRELLKD